MIGNNSSKRWRSEDLRVDPSARPDWKTGLVSPPIVGWLVYCTAGMAEVRRVLGKTSAGGRLLELRLLDGTKAPFFAAEANVLVAPEEKTV